MSINDLAFITSVFHGIISLDANAADFFKINSAVFKFISSFSNRRSRKSQSPISFLGTELVAHMQLQRHDFFQKDCSHFEK